MIKPEKPCPRPISPFILPKKPHNIIFPKKIVYINFDSVVHNQKSSKHQFFIKFEKFHFGPILIPFGQKNPVFLISLSHFKVRWYHNSMQKLGYLLQVILDKKWTNRKTGRAYILGISFLHSKVNFQHFYFTEEIFLFYPITHQKYL